MRNTDNQEPNKNEESKALLKKFAMEEDEFSVDEDGNLQTEGSSACFKNVGRK